MFWNSLKNSKLFVVKNQFLAVLCANLASLNIGLSIGWLSPAIQTLESNNDTPLLTGPLTVDEISWIGAIMHAGGFIAHPIIILIDKHFGRKKALASIILPLTISWLLIIFATNVIYLYMSRLIAGTVFGGVFICIPLMVAEIADDNVRGILGALLSSNQYLGILLSYIIGAYVPYNYVPYIMLPIPIIFFVLFMFVPESPLYLIKTNQGKAAEKSLKFYKNCQGNTMEDIERFQTEMTKLLILSEKVNSTENIVRAHDFITPAAFRAFAIGAILMYFYGYCGSVVLLTYGATIFRDSGSDFDANISAIIMGTAQLLGTLSAVVFIDKFGRRIMYMISTGGTMIAVFAAGVFTYLAHVGYQMDGFSWVPVVSISLSLYCSCIGIVPVSIVLMAELLPSKIRSAGSMICLLMLTFSLFTSLKIYPIISDAAGLHVTLWIFAGNSLLGLLFSIFVLKETKGKSINVEN